MSKINWEMQLEITNLMYKEARLLDERRFHEWIELFTDDVRYWMPVRESVQGDGTDIPHKGDSFALFDDDKESLMLRIDRLDTGKAFAESPPSLTQRTIANVEVEAAGCDDEVRVYSNFTVHIVRPDREGSFIVGRRIDSLRRVGGQWKIANRDIIPAQIILPRAISIFL